MTAFDGAINVVVWGEECVGEKVTVNDLGDGAGRTCAGITEKNFPDWPGWQLIDSRVDLNSQQMISAIKSFYFLNFWQPLRCDDLPKRVAVLLFDFAINSGKGLAIKSLQRIAGVVADGAIGPATIAAVNAANPEILFSRLFAEQLSHWIDCGNWNKFGAGWIRRAIHELRNI